jgi:hypothetical protein
MIPYARMISNMSRYVARHPKTGKPLYSEKEVEIETSLNPPISKWDGLELSLFELKKLFDQILPLAIGEISKVEINHLDIENEKILLDRTDGIRALPRLNASYNDKLYDALILGLYDPLPENRIASLQILHICACRKPDGLWDILAELLDDDVAEVRRTAIKSLIAAVPIFPSGCEVLLHIELRHELKLRRDGAWKALNELLKKWPDAAMAHLDILSREDDVDLRRRSANLLSGAANRKSAIAWDLVSWALQDEDDLVRDNASKAIRTVTHHEPRQALIFAERALFDTYKPVRARAVQALEKLGAGSRVNSLIIRGCKHSDLEIRRNCIKMLPRLMSEDELRDLCFELLNQEKNITLKEILTEYSKDDQLEGSELEKNKYLAPAEPIDQLEKEIKTAEVKKEKKKET